MKRLFSMQGFTPYILVVLLNAVTDLGHKIVIQNTIFKSFEGTEQIALTAVVNGLILLPFVFLFTPAGFLSDRFSRDKVIKICAALTVPLTVCILLTYKAGLFWPSFLMTLALAVQSAFYSPAKYGYIKELVGKDHLAEANGVVQAVTIVAILGGAVLFSLLFEGLLAGLQAAPGEILKTVSPCGYVLVGLALAETFLALRLKCKVPGDSSLSLTLRKYVRGGYLKENVGLLRRNETIWLSIVGLSIFWAVNQVLLAAFGAHLKEAAQVTNTAVAQTLLAMGGIGVIVGSLAAGKVSRNFIETGTIPVGALGMTVALFLLPGMENRVALGAVIFGYGLFGGLLIVPLNALIQFNAREHELGTVLAGNNFIQNLLMLLFLVSTVVLAQVGVSSVPLFLVLGVVVLGGAVYTVFKLPQSLLRYVVGLILSQHYKISVKGLGNIPSSGGVLLLGNHTSWIDWAVLHIVSPRRLRFVMDREIYQRWWWLRKFLDLFGVIPISARAHRGAIRATSDALARGDCVVLFPEGAISRNGQLGTFKRGFEEAAKDTGCTIVPFYIRGLWGSAFSFASRKLRTTSRLKRTREVTVCFGRAMADTASAQEVKQAVFRLSIDAWQAYTELFTPVHVSWLKAAKGSLSRPAVIDSAGITLSSARLLATCLPLSRLLGQKTRKQDRVGILLPAGAGGVIANLSVLMRGKTVVNLNYTTGARTMRAAMDRAGIRTVVSAGKFLTRLQAKKFEVDEALAGREILDLEDLLSSLPGWKFFLAFVQAWVVPEPVLRLLYFKSVPLDKTAAILFSSGSEGTPKGIMLSHRNIVGNCRQAASVFNAGEGDAVLSSLPLFHAFGMTMTTFMPLLESIPMVCHADPTDARQIGRVVARHHVTFLCATPTFLGLYARNRRLHPLMFDSLKFVVSGAERLSDEVRTAFKEKFGLQIFEGYGTTETTPVVSVNVRDVLNTSDFTVQQGSKQGTVGLPLPGSTVRIVDPATLEDLPQGTEGLILIGGTQIMKGYLDDPDKTEEVIVEQGGIRWYKSGDKGRLDEDGFLVIVDRYSRFAKIGGEMVSLTAVEEALERIVPEGAAIAAVAIPDAKKGEKVVALVSGVDEPESLRKGLLESGVDPLMVPGSFLTVDEIPKLGTGKRDLAGAKQLALAAAK